MLSMAIVDRPEGLVARSIEDWRIPIGDLRKPGELAHSLIYEDPRVHTKLVEWLAGSGG
jgi:hypothetical protein